MFTKSVYYILHFTYVTVESEQTWKVWEQPFQKIDTRTCVCYFVFRFQFSTFSVEHIKILLVSTHISNHQSWIKGHNLNAVTWGEMEELMMAEGRKAD